MKKIFSIFLLTSLIIFSFLLGSVIGQSKNFVTIFSGLKPFVTFQKLQSSKEVDFDLFWDVWNLIQEKYIDRPVDEARLFYGALSGMVKSLEDPYSVYLEPEIAEEFTQELAGSFEGIGAEIGIKGDRLTIIAPLAGSPAEKAGLKAGDKVYFIDDYDTIDIALDYAVSLIRGPKGSSVILTILRNGLKEPKKNYYYQGCD
jgi:carboxyl-terminal processing protease